LVVVVHTLGPALLLCLQFVGGRDLILQVLDNVAEFTFILLRLLLLLTYLSISCQCPDVRILHLGSFVSNFG
jgi:hypothetical protein